MLKRISVADLRPGMHVREVCGSWLSHPFWREDFVLEDVADVRRLAESGVAEVVVDSVEPAAAPVPGNVPPSLPPTAPAAAPTPRHAPVAEELHRAARICAKSKEAMVSMFHEARMGKAVDAEAADELVDDIASSVQRNPDALISLARLRSADDYTYMHSLAVCALMVAVARQLGFDEAASREIGMAGLLHDLGKAMTPPAILNKPGRLTGEEFAVIRRHPGDGHQLLRQGSAIGAIALDVCLHHHEKIDGSGYPERLAEASIGLYAKMCAVCDVYDAITSNRAYKAGWDPAESIRRMTEWRPQHFDERVFLAFVKTVGIYPVGSLVRLSSGRIGVVVEQSGRSLVMPQVRVFFSARSQAHLPPETVDLSRPGCAEKIVGREDAAKWGFGNLEEHWARLA